MKSKSLIVNTLSIAAVAAFASSASGQIILSDSFSRINGSGDGNGNPLGAGNGLSDWGSNDNAFGGSSVQTYTFGQGRAGGANQTTDGSTAQMYSGAAQIELDLAPLTTAAGGYTVQFDFQRTAGNGFIALGIGLDDTDQIESLNGFNANTFLFTSGANGAEGAVLMKQNGDVEMWAGGNAAAQTIGGFYTDPEAWHTATITVSAPGGYGATAAGTVSLSIDGGGAASQGITFDGISSAWLSLYSNQNGLQLDNLTITTIPEPTTFALMGLGGLGLLVARRRR